MSEKGRPVLGALIVGAVIGFFWGVCYMQLLHVDPLKAKAVEHGAAEWTINPKDGTTKFTWKEVAK